MLRFLIGSPRSHAAAGECRRSLTGAAATAHPECTLLDWRSLGLGRFDHVTPSLIQLHWLPVRFIRVYFKLCCFIHAIYNGRIVRPTYLTETVQSPGRRCRSRSALRSSFTSLLEWLPFMAVSNEIQWSYVFTMSYRFCNLERTAR